MKHKVVNHYLRVLVYITIVDSLILLVRNLVVGSNHFNFLFWNLFLAIIPMGVALLLHYFYGKWGKLAIILGSCLWLLFYPNAPYMISDTIHVDENCPPAFQNLQIYDALIIFLLAILALLYGFFSLKIMKNIFSCMFGRKWSLFIINFCVVLSSFGIYLGRILRLNSWDLFTHPMVVLKSIFDHLFPISKNPTTYVIIFLFSFIQFSLLLLMKDLEEPVGYSKELN